MLQPNAQLISKRIGRRRSIPGRRQAFQGSVLLLASPIFNVLTLCPTHLWSLCRFHRRRLNFDVTLLRWRLSMCWRWQVGRSMLKTFKPGFWACCALPQLVWSHLSRTIPLLFHSQVTRMWRWCVTWAVWISLLESSVAPLCCQLGQWMSIQYIRWLVMACKCWFGTCRYMRGVGQLWWRFLSQWESWLPSPKEVRLIKSFSPFLFAKKSMLVFHMRLS